MTKNDMYVLKYFVLNFFLAMTVHTLLIKRCTYWYICTNKETKQQFVIQYSKLGSSYWVKKCDKLLVQRGQKISIVGTPSRGAGRKRTEQLPPSMIMPKSHHLLVCIPESN